MGQIVDFPHSTSLRPEQAIGSCAKVKWTQFIGLGLTEAGEFEIVNSDMTAERALWLIEWTYSELKGEIKLIQSQHSAMFERIAQQREADRLLHQDWLIDAIKRYVPKEDVVRLEERILEAISRLEFKIDRHRPNAGE